MIKNAIIIAIVCFGFVKGNAQGNLINVLNEAYYGFEANNGWWMQHPDNFSIVDEKAANGSSRSLKYESDILIATGSLKAHGSATIPGMKVDLDAGTYTMKAMVWIDPAAEITGFRLTLKPSFTNVIFDLSGQPKEEWVEVTSEIVLNSDTVDGNFQVIMEPTFGGKGILYIDDLQLLDEAPPVIETIAPSVEIVTNEEENISLEKGAYEVNLKVWIDATSTMKDFYTIVSEPWIATKWDISSIAKEEWVTLKKEIILDAKAENSEFRVKVNNTSETKGSFYIDDISFVKGKELYEENDNISIKVTGETCPNKGNGQIEITAKHNFNYQLSFNGTDHNFTDELILENVVPDNYELCITVVGTDFKSCFGAEVPESASITGEIAALKASSVAINIEKGTAPYNVSVNGLNVLTTHSNSFNVAASSGDIIEIKSKKDCEGVITKKLNLINTVKVYPNPIKDIMNVISPEVGDITIYNMLGELIFSASNTKEIVSEPVALSSGIYIVKVVTKGKVFTEKVIVE